MLPPHSFTSSTSISPIRRNSRAALPPIGDPSPPKRTEPAGAAELGFLLVVFAREAERLRRAARRPWRKRLTQHAQITIGGVQCRVSEVRKGSNPESGKGATQSRLSARKRQPTRSSGGSDAYPAHSADVSARQRLDQSPGRKRLDVSPATGAA